MASGMMDNDSLRKIKIEVDPTLPNDTIEFRHPETGETQLTVTNVVSPALPPMHEKAALQDAIIEAARIIRDRAWYGGTVGIDTHDDTLKIARELRDLHYETYRDLNRLIDEYNEWKTQSEET